MLQLFSATKSEIAYISLPREFRVTTEVNEEIASNDFSPSVLVKMRGPKPPIKPKPKTRSGERKKKNNRVKRNSSTRMGPLGTLTISRTCKETII